MDGGTGIQMTMFDVTRPISPSVPHYPGDPSPEIVTKDHGSYRTTDLHLSTHTGTHIDAPSHYLDGATTIDRLPLSHLMGPCLVLDLTSCGDTIEEHHLQGRLTDIQRVFCKTRASAITHFGTSFPHLDMTAATSLFHQGIVCVGIDSPSIEAYHGDGSLHRLLLSHGIAIIELLDLSKVLEGTYWMVALPLRLQGLDGSPARVILMDINEVHHDHYH